MNLNYWINQYTNNKFLVLCGMNGDENCYGKCEIINIDFDNDSDTDSKKKDSVYRQFK